MSDVAVAAVGLALATVAIKAAGPVALGGRRLPERLARALAVLPAALLAALVVTETFERDGRLVLDARLAGLAAAALALWRGAPMLVAVLSAAVAVALVRLAGG